MRVSLGARRLVVVLAGVVLGAGYGLFARYAFDHPGGDAGARALGAALVAMSVCYLFLVPLAMGVFTALFAPRTSRWRWAYFALMPVVNCAILFAVVVALAFEGLICLVMAAPLYFGMALLGGVVTGGIIAIREHRKAPVPTATLASALVLPFALAPLEARLPVRDDLRAVRTAVAIDAGPGTVWREIVRVPEIRDHEQRPGFFHAIGIPRPLEATLSGDGVGGVRLARFEGGIVFHDTVSEWEPERGFAFTIRVDPSSTGTSFDEHVTVGSAHFDVVHASKRVVSRCRLSRCSTTAGSGSSRGPSRTRSAR